MHLLGQKGKVKNKLPGWTLYSLSKINGSDTTDVSLLIVEWFHLETIAGCKMVLLTLWIWQSVIEAWQRCEQSAVIYCGRGQLLPELQLVEDISSANPGWLYLDRCSMRSLLLHFLHRLIASSSVNMCNEGTFPGFVKMIYGFWLCSHVSLNIDLINRLHIHLPLGNCTWRTQS